MCDHISSFKPNRVTTEYISTEDEKKANKILYSMAKIVTYYPNSNDDIVEKSSKGAQLPIQELRPERRSDDEYTIRSCQDSGSSVTSTSFRVRDGDLRKLSSHEVLESSSSSSRSRNKTIINNNEPLLSEEKRTELNNDARNDSTEHGDNETPVYLPPKLSQKYSIDSLTSIDKYYFVEITADDIVRLADDANNNSNPAKTDSRLYRLGTATDDASNTYESTNPNYTYDDYTIDDGISYLKTKTSDGIWRLSKDSGVSNDTSDSNNVPVKQSVAWTCILLSASQFGVLSTQILLCGFASISVNPMIGPYPDAISEFGGKNTYLLLEEEQYYRLVTPIFLHVGFVHLLINVFFQLKTCAYLEREWGFFLWIFIYALSGFGSCLIAYIIDPDTISVCSSGALMGLFGAKIAHAITWSVFTLKKEYRKQGRHMIEQLGGVVWSATLVFLLTFLTYIDWSGHLGGLFTGFLAGIALFSYAIADGLSRTIWTSIGIAGIVIGATLSLSVLFTITKTDEELSDACNYFRSLYSEGYICECAWD